jgi:two-component system chemotaxis response regulator CheB
MDDGTAGLWAIKARGGVTVVQDPQDAEYSSMPQSAIDHVKVDHVVKAQEMGALLHRLTAETVQGNGGPVSENLNIESAIAREAYPLDNGVLTLGPPTDLTCPECHGVLRQVKEGDILRYRCHTGHAFSADSLLAEITQSLESTLWSTLRSVEESVLLLTRMVEQLQRSGAVSLAHKAQQKMEEVSHRAMTIRQVILAHEHLSLELLGKE